MKKFIHFSEQIFRLRLPRIIILGGILLIISTVVSRGQTGNIPDAVDDNPSTLEDTSLESNVSSNDTQAEGTNVWTLVTNVDHGELTFNSDGTYDYIPDLDYNGTDNFTYRLCDGDSDCDKAIVNITITAVNDMPSFVGGENQSINEDSGAQTIIGWATGIDDEDPDIAQVLGFNVSNDNTGLFSAQPAISTDGTLTFTSASDVFGIALVTVTLTDDDNAGGPALTTAEQTFSISVNPLADTPTVTNAATNEDTQTISGLVISRNVNDRAEVTHFKISNIQNGTLYQPDGITLIANNAFITAAQAMAGLRFTPSLNSTLNGSFEIQSSLSANDAGIDPMSGTATATITVAAVNDGPINTFPGAQTVAEGATLVFSAGNSNAISVSDIDVAETVNGTLQIELSVSNGLLTLSQVTGLTFEIGDGTADAAMTIRGLPANLNAALSGMQFIGYPEDFNGDALLTIRTMDLGQTGSGGAKVDQDDISIDVISSNDAPTLTSVSTLTGGTEDTDFTITYATLLAAADEADIDGDPIFFRIETVSSGTLTKEGIAVVPGMTLLGSGESLVWTPALNSNDVLDAFTVKSWDGLLASADPSIQVRVEVTGVNDAPVVTDIPNQTIPEGSTFTTINLENYVTDVDNLATEISWEATGTTVLTVDIVDRVATISTPSADWNGSETITFIATDPGLLSDSDDAVFTVTAVIDLPPGWEVNPPDFNHSGQITAKAYINQSAIESGFLAAFVGEECRGIVDTSYFPPSDHFVYSLMFYSNNAVGDTLTFKYYDPVEDKIYKMDTSFVFIPDMIVGNAITPKLMYEGIDYNNSFKVGWNWFSVNARYDNMSLNSILSSCAMLDDYIKSQDSTATYYSGFGWWGSLDKLSPRDLYKVRVANPCGIKFLGRPVDISTEVVNIVPGWNWIGYYPQTTLPIDDALTSLTLTQFDNIKSQVEVSTFYDGLGWFGELDSLKPTEGYMIKVTLPGTLTYPEIPELKSATVYQEKDKTGFCPARFEFSGTITAKVVKDGEQDRYEGNLLLAIVNNEIRGVVESHYFAPLDAWLYPLMIHSNLSEGEIVHFRFYDKRNDKFYSCEETLTFKNDMIVADAFKAFELNVKSGSGINDPELEGLELRSYPNPFNMALNIEYQIKEQAHISLTIYDISGKIIDIPVDQLQDPDRYIIQWNSSKQPAGTYIIKLNAGDKHIIRKVSLVR